MGKVNDGKVENCHRINELGGCQWKRIIYEKLWKYYFEDLHKHTVGTEERFHLVELSRTKLEMNVRSYKTIIIIIIIKE